MSVNKYLNKDEIWQLNTVNLIFHIRLDLFHSFIHNLIDEMFNTFAGFDVINNIKVRTAHFEYCLKNVVGRFRDMHVHFDLTQKAKTLLFMYFISNFYQNPQSDSYENENQYLKDLKFEILKDWDNVLKYFSQKTRDTYDKFKLVYNALEESLVFTY